MENYYTWPFQVRYWRPDTKELNFGIVYHDFVVDAFDGTPFSVKDIVASAPVPVDEAIVEYSEWYDLSVAF